MRTGHAAQDDTHNALMRERRQTNSDKDKTARHDDRQDIRPIKRGKEERVLPMRSNRSMATVSKARRIMGYSSSTSLKWSTESEKSRQ